MLHGPDDLHREDTAAEPGLTNSAVTGEPWLLSDACQFETTRGDEALAEAARRLGVTLLGGRANGFHNKSAGSVVTLPDGASCWMRVTGVIGFSPRDARQAEFEANALNNIPKPTLTRLVEWDDNDVHWDAVLMTLAPSLATSSTLWREPDSKPLPAQWFVALRQALVTLRTTKVPRRMLTPDQVQFLIASQIGPEAPTVAAEWHAAHGDLQWTNLTGPDLMLLDWERWGMAPRGYTVGRLLAFSLLEPIATREILAVSADEFRNPSACVGMLAAIAEVKVQLDAGSYDARLKTPLDQLIAGILDAERRLWPLGRRVRHQFDGMMEAVSTATRRWRDR